MKNTVLFCLLFMSCSLRSWCQNITNNGDTIYIPNGVTMTVGGNFSNLDNGTKYPYVKNEGVLQLAGDFVKSANMIYTGNDSIILNGTGTQNITGLSYWYMNINTGGNKSFSSDAYIKNKLVLSNGTISTGINTIILDSQASLTEDSVNNITGNVKMQKYLAQGTNYTFGGMGLELNATNMAPGMTTVTRVTGAHLNGNGYQSVNRYFIITPANNGNTGSIIKFNYYDGELNSLSDNDLAVYRHRTNGKWEYDGYNSRNTGSNYLMASADTLGTVTAGSILNPLPVEMLSFDAKLFNPQTAKLNWATASEINNDHFDIERSEDGKSFLKVGEVKGNGNTNTISDYDYYDNFGITTAAILYYRLRQVDYNGEYKYSDIRKLKLSGQDHNFRAWYNSSTDKTEAFVFYEKETHASLRMIDIQGKLIAEQQVTFPVGESHLQLEMYGLAQGIYTISIADENKMEVKRVMKY